VVIRYLPHNTPVEDTSDGLVSLNFDVVSVKQMTATCRSPPKESKIINLPLFLVTLPKTANNLPALCGAEADTCTRTAQRRETLFPHEHAVAAIWRKKRKPIPIITTAADTRRSSYRRGKYKEHPILQREGCSQISPPQVFPSRRRSEAADSSNSCLRHSMFQW
jgi:hypothetical protein